MSLHLKSSKYFYGAHVSTLTPRENAIRIEAYSVLGSDTPPTCHHSLHNVSRSQSKQALQHGYDESYSREIQVKCDRAQPVCSQCMKVGKKCEYTDQEKPKVEFVNQHRDSVAESDENTALLSGTWNSVLDNQVAFVKKAEEGNNGAPVWAVAEAEEEGSPFLHGNNANVGQASRPRPQILETNEPFSRSHVIPIGALGEKFVFAITNCFPTREECQPFFESFLLGIHPIVPICHIPLLHQQYEKFWTEVSPSYSVESLALMLAVLYTGAANANCVDILNTSTLLRLYEEIFLTVDFASYHPRNISASIQLLQGYVIMSTFKASQLAPFLAFGFLPQVIRFAQSLRLHTEAKQRNPIEIGVRRRLWWHLISLDIESTIATGLPTIIHRDGYTTQLPALGHDSAIPDIDRLASPQSDFSPMVIAMYGHYQWVHRIQTWFACLPSRDDVSSFKNVIQSLVNLVPDNNQPENEWVRTYLKMQMDRAYCMLGLRFWQIDQYKGTACHSEVIEMARSFLTHYLQLSTLPKMTHFSWFMPGIIQPIHALIILLMHLSTCPNICEEQSNRDLLDQIMSLRVNRILRGNVISTEASIREDNLPQVATPRYLIMAELRRRVWKKVGWDSDGKGIHPWAGRTVQGEVVSGGKDELVPDPQLGMKTSHIDAAVFQDLSTGWDTNETTGLEGLDHILAGDPMDLFQWDEWESLASDFFAS